MSFWKYYLMVLLLLLPLAALAEAYQDQMINKSTCRIVKKPLQVLRLFFKSINLEKIAPITLGISLICVAALTLCGLRIHPEYSSPDCDEGLFEVLRVAFSVFEGDSNDFRNHVSFSPFLYFLSALLSILVPLSTVATAATLIWSYLPHHVPWFSHVWYIFSALDTNSIRMAKSIHKELEHSGDSGVFIFLRTRRGKQEPDVLDELKEINYFFYPKNEQRFLFWPWRRERKLKFFFLSENTDDNFNRLQDFLCVCGEHSLFYPRPYSLPDGQFQHELFLLSETESAPMLIDHLRNSLDNPKYGNTFYNTDLRLLDRFRAVSYDLLRCQPLYEFSENGQLNILLLGFGRIGREFFRAARSMGVLPGCKAEFTICDQDICTKLNQFRTNYPEFREPNNVNPRQLDVDSEALDALIRKSAFHYIVVALGDDERNIRVASRLKRYYRRSYWDKSIIVQPQICVNIEDSIKHAYTQSLWKAQFDWDKSIYAFGGLDQAFTRAVLMPVNLWAAARYVHKLVNDSQGADLRLWSEYQRRSSIASAAHAACYISHLLGKDCFKENTDLSVPYQARWNALSSSQQEDLISKEHERWMAYVRSEGMQCTSTDLLRNYFGEIKSHVDIHARLTPCLVDVAELETVQNTVDQLREQYWSENLLKNPPVKFRTRDRRIVENAAHIYEIINPKQQPTSSL